jgi:hypothetical protein
MKGMLNPVHLRPIIKAERSTSSTVMRRLDPVYTEDWRYPLTCSAEAHTIPTRACTEVFYSGSQHGGGDSPMDSGDSYSGKQTNGGGH